jgi:hypothetical protein
MLRQGQLGQQAQLVREFQQLELMGELGQLVQQRRALVLQELALMHPRYLQ